MWRDKSRREEFTVREDFSDVSLPISNQLPSRTTAAPALTSANAATVAVTTANPPVPRQAPAPIQPPNQRTTTDPPDVAKMKDQINNLHWRVQQLTELIVNPPSAEVPLAMLAATVHMPTIAVKLQGAEVPAMIDTRSQVTLITSDVFKKLGFTLSPTPKTFCGLGISGTFTIHGFLDLTFEINGISYTINTGITDNLPVSILLGHDFIVKYHVNIKAWEDMAYFQDTPIPLLKPHEKTALEKFLCVYQSVKVLHA